MSHSAYSEHPSAAAAFARRLLRSRAVWALAAIVIASVVLLLNTYFSAYSRSMRRLGELNGISSGETLATPFTRLPPDVLQSEIVRELGLPMTRLDLSGFNMEQKPVTDRDLQAFTGAFPDFRSAMLSGTRITDESLANMADAWPDLIRLRANDCAITDAGVHELPRLRHLYDVALDRTQITDRALVDLAQLPELENLSIAGTQVTDAGLAHLQPATRLKRLNISDTRAAPAGIAAFQSAHPTCTVVR